MKYFLAAFALMVLVAILFGCARPSPKSMSWDQENLKRNDHGCPTAIYVAPGGNLEMCKP